MAFDLNNLANSVSKSVSKLGQEASTKTKNVTENFKINSAVSEQKKLIDEMYKSIGKKYFENKADEAEEIFLVEVSNIKKALEKISELEKQQMELKGFCSSCGNKLTPGAAYCINCGAKINED